MMNTGSFKKRCLHGQRMESSFQEQAELESIRWGSQMRGKRGSFRVIYYWHAARQLLLMLYLYSKAEQGDLTAVQRRGLGTMAFS